MTYLDQRKILFFIRSHFEFRADRYYYFDLSKSDLDNSLLVCQEFLNREAFIERTRVSEKNNELNILVRPNRSGEIVLGVNGDGFDYFENLTTGEIEYDNCPSGPIDPIQLKLELLKLKRELNGGKVD